VSRGVGTFWIGSGGRKSPSGVQGQSPGSGSGGQSPPEADGFLDLGPQFFVKISTKISLFNATNIKNLTLVQSAVLRSHVVCLSVCLSVTLVNCDHIG